MEGTLKRDGESWYIEYVETNTNGSLAPGVSLGTPSKFALKQDNLDKIASGEWLATEGRIINFDLQNLPYYPFYEADIHGRHLHNVHFKPTASMSPTTIATTKMVTKYVCYVRFNGNTTKIICDRYSAESIFIYFQIKRRNEHAISDGMRSYLNEFIYENIGIFPSAATAVYPIKEIKVEEII